MQWLNNGKEKLKQQKWEVDNEYRFPISGFGSGNERSAGRNKNSGRGDNEEKQKENLEE